MPASVVLRVCCLAGVVTLVVYLYSTSEIYADKVGATGSIVSETTFSLEQEPPSSKLPLILGWNEFSGKPLFKKQRLTDSCPFECIYTNDRSQKNDAAVIVFHVGSFLNATSVIYDLANSTALRVFFNLEPPPHRKFYTNFPDAFFDYSVSYRRDSSLYMPYDRFTPLEVPGNGPQITDEQVEQAIAQKSSDALIFVSHCQTDSGREDVVDALSKHINITQYGKCNQQECTRSGDCEAEEIKTHYFYLAFENSVCNEYVTEKFWRLKKLIVPIVLDRSVFQGTVLSALHPYFIAVSDFPSIEALAAHLRYLMTNHTAYAEYFSWTQKYSPKESWEDDKNGLLCEYCKIAWNASGTAYPVSRSFLHWWEDEAKCKHHFGDEFLNSNRSRPPLNGFQ